MKRLTSSLFVGLLFPVLTGVIIYIDMAITSKLFAIINPTYYIGQEFDFGMLWSGALSVVIWLTTFTAYFYLLYKFLKRYE